MTPAPPIDPRVDVGHVHLKVADIERAIAFYLRDPDGNGLELYRDRPAEEWPRTASGEIEMFTHPLDVEALLKEAAGA